jgi:hypothetical protein
MVREEANRLTFKTLADKEVNMVHQLKDLDKDFQSLEPLEHFPQIHQ